MLTNKYFFILFTLILLFSCSKKVTTPNSVNGINSAGNSDYSFSSERDKYEGLSSAPVEEVIEEEIEEKVKEPDPYEGMSLAEQIKIKTKEQSNSIDEVSQESTPANTINTVIHPIGHITEIKDKNANVVKQKRISLTTTKRSDNIFSYKRTANNYLPADYRIGLLSDLNSSAYKTKKINTNLTTFFTELAENNIVTKDLIFPGAYDLIQNNLSYYIESGAIPDPLFRIGNHEYQDKITRVNLRFYLNDGSADGEVILEENIANGIKNWLISDIQVNFSTLLTPYQGVGDAFFPSSYDLFDWE